MKFSDPSKILDTIEYGNNVEWVRSNNRRKINDGFNGVPPLSATDAEKMGMKINFNSGEMAVLGQQARRQYGNAFGKPANFFKIKLPSAPPEIRTDWESKLTRLINRQMKDSLGYFETQRETFASVVAHGIGPKMWLDSERWEPEMVALEDLRVPTDTRTNLKNLTWFALRKKYTVGELVKKALGENADKGWQRDNVMSILKEYQGQTTQVTDSTVYENPEYWADLIKQNGGFYTSDASPSIPLWHFYFVDKSGKVFLRVVPARECRGTIPGKFVFDNGDIAVANRLREIISVQFGDLNSKAPFLWHSVRSLGFLLREPCFWLDVMRCRVMGHCMENMNMGFRVSNPADRGRVQKLQLMDKFVLDSGVSIIPNTERHQIDAGLIETTMAQLKQLQGEASVSFTQDLETGSNKEMTATETMARLSQVNALMTGLILTAVTYAKFEYKEICRRFTIEKSEDPDVREFREQALREGIPPQFIDSKRWDVEPEVPMGDGNPTMEMAKAQALMQVRPLHSPASQDAILHMYDEAVTGNADTAEFLVPTNRKPMITDAQAAAQFAFPVLMMGVPVNLPEHLNPVEQIITLTQMLGASVTPYVQGQAMPTQEQVIGFQNVIAYIASLLERIAMDEGLEPLVNDVTKELSAIDNEVKAMAQRVQEQQEAMMSNGGISPEAQAKILEADIVTNFKEAKTASSHAQKMAQKEQQFQANEARKDAQTAAEIQRKFMQAEADIATKPKPEPAVAG